MPNPRKTPSRLGTGLLTKTFIADGITILFDRTLPGGATTAILNKAVSLSADGTVQLAADAEAIIGKLILVEADLRCTVVTDGVVLLPSGAGATITRGAKIVGDLDGAARGFIRAAASAVAAELLAGRGQIYSNADTANVEVKL